MNKRCLLNCRKGDIIHYYSFINQRTIRYFVVSTSPLKFQREGFSSSFGIHVWYNDDTIRITKIIKAPR